MMDMKNVLEVKNLSLRSSHDLILDNVSFEVSKQDILTILGPNGAGKSTMINCILKIISNFSGTISFPFYEEAGKAPIIGYVAQHSPSKFTNVPLTVREFMDVSSNPYVKWPRSFFSGFTQRMKKTLEDLEISHLIDRRIDQISGGEFQKIMIASALCLDPNILILDDPSIALDAKSREKLMTILKNLQNNGSTIIVISHDIEVITSLSSKVLYLEKSIKFFGKIGDYCALNLHSGCFELSNRHLIWHNH